MTMLQRFARRSAAMSLACAGLLSLGAPAHAAPKIDQKAPAFVGIDTKGKEVRLSDLRGKTVVLEWTNHDCPFVAKHYRTGNMQALQKKYGGTDVVWLSVISSAPGTQGHVSPAKADELTSSRDAKPTAVLLDPKGTIGRMYKARTTPHMYVIDPEGVLRYMGAIDNKPTTRDADVKRAKNYVKAAMTKLTAGAPVDPSVTRAYGCSVKYGPSS
ncbi:MAG: redoxin domain-containing protein [Pseudomonadota bacterium]